MSKYHAAHMEQSDCGDGAFGTVTDKNKPGAKNEASQNSKSDAISKHLKDAYRSVVEEPLPDVFEDLLSQLDERLDEDDDTSSNGSKDQ